MFKRLFIVAGLALTLAACEQGYSTTGSGSPINIGGDGDGDIENQAPPVIVEPAPEPEPEPEPESCPVDTPSNPFCSDESHAACNCVPE